MKKRILFCIALLVLTGLCPVWELGAEENAAPVKLSLGYEHSGIVKEDHTLWLWGDNSYGQLGNGSLSNSNKPIQVMEDVKDICLGDGVTAVIKMDGSLWMWGKNDMGQLGIHAQTPPVQNPVKVLEDVEQVALGSGFSAAVKTDGSLWAWGSNEYGQLGDGTGQTRLFPTKIMNDVKLVRLGEKHAGVIKKDNSLWTWGNNCCGQIGNSSVAEEGTKIPVKIAVHVADLSMGGCNSAMILEDGEFLIWGSNEYDRIGNGKISDYFHPLKLMDDMKTASLGGTHCSALRKDGRLWLWGCNKNGQIGNGLISTSIDPKIMMSDVAAVSLGKSHTGVIKTDGSLWMWGSNEKGQLGDSSNQDRLDPVNIIKAKPVEKEENNSSQNTGSSTQNTGSTTENSGGNPSNTGQSKPSSTVSPKPVKKVKQTIKAASLTVPYGKKPFSLNAKASGNGKLTYRSSNSKIVSVSSKGKVGVKNYGSVVVQIKAAAKGNYLAASKKIRITVVPAGMQFSSVRLSSNRSVLLKWKKNTKISGYEIQISLSSQFKNRTKQKSLSNKNTQIKVSGFQKGKNYYFRIRAYKKTGSKKYYGAWSKGKKLKIR